VTDGATNTNPRHVVVWPGTYTENVALAAGVNVASGGSDAGYVATMNGRLTVDYTGIASWTGVNITGPGSGSALSFTGSGYQKLFLYNTVIYGNSTSPAVAMTNTGTEGGRPSEISGWDNLVRAFNAAARAMDVDAGIVNGPRWEVTASAASGVSLDVSGPVGTRVSLSNSEILGQVLVGGSATFNLTQATINSGANPAVVAGQATPAQVVLGQIGVNTSSNPVFTDTGTGPLVYTGITFGGTGIQIPATAIRLLTTGNGGLLTMVRESTGVDGGPYCFPVNSINPQINVCGLPYTKTPVPPGIASYLVVWVETAPPAPVTYSVTRNGTAVVSCTITSPATTCADRTSLAYFAEGDLISIQWSSSWILSGAFPTTSLSFRYAP
jgi:hypothetical protein